MSVITKQTLILKTCGDLARNENRPRTDGAFISESRENAAFLNFTLAGGKAEAKITFIKPADLKNACLVFDINKQFKIFDFSGVLPDNNNVYKFDFNQNDYNLGGNTTGFSQTNYSCEQNKTMFSALVVCNGTPALFACAPKNHNFADENFGFNAEKSEFKELLSFYEKNYKANDKRAYENEADVFHQKKDGTSKRSEEGKSDSPDGSTRTANAESAESAIELIKSENELKTSKSADLPSGIKADDLGEKYDDEAVATENYYEVAAQQLFAESEPKNNKIPLYKADEIALTHENSAKTPLFGSDNDKEKKEDDLQINEDARTFNCGKQSKTQKENESRTDSFENGASGCENQKRTTENLTPPFYLSVKDEIENLFEKYPPEPALNELIPDSRWVKIDYGGGKDYVVGVIDENGVPAHIAYGIKGNRIFKPRAASDYSLFFPVSRFILGDEGYWCMFQSAQSGETEKF